MQPILNFEESLEQIAWISAACGHKASRVGIVWTLLNQSVIAAGIAGTPHEGLDRPTV